MVLFHLCLRTFEVAEKVSEVGCFACQFASDTVVVKVSVVVAVVKVWTRWFVLTTQHGLSQAKHPGFSWSATGLRERRGREHGSKGAAVAFPEDGWLGNDLLQSGAGV